MNDGGCLRPQLPRHHLWDVPGELRVPVLGVFEVRPWFSEGMTCSELQNHPLQQHYGAGIVLSVSVGCMEKPQGQSRCSQR